MANSGTRIISIKTENAEKLARLKEYPRESYDSVIGRIIGHPKKEKRAEARKSSKANKSVQTGISLPIERIEQLEKLRTESKQSYWDIINVAMLKYLGKPAAKAKAKKAKPKANKPKSNVTKVRITKQKAEAVQEPAKAEEAKPTEQLNI